MPTIAAATEQRVAIENFMVLQMILTLNGLTLLRLQHLFRCYGSAATKYEIQRPRSEAGAFTPSPATDAMPRGTRVT